MKTFEDLKSQVKRYLTSNTNLVNAWPGQAGDTNALMAEIDSAILVAANNARRQAEMRHDFGISIMTGYATLVVGGSVDLDHIAVDEVGGTDFRSFKTLREVFVVNTDGTMYPVKIVSQKTKSIQLFKQQDLGKHTYQEGYIAVVSGRQLTMERQAVSVTLSLAITGSVWLEEFTAEVATTGIYIGGLLSPDITGDCAVVVSLNEYAAWSRGTQGSAAANISYNFGAWRINPMSSLGQYSAYKSSTESSPIGLTDWTMVRGAGQPILTQAVTPVVFNWFLERGFEYLQWAVICELNHMLLKFVPRQEGTLGPPDSARDKALDALIVNDAYATDGDIYHDL